MSRSVSHTAGISLQIVREIPWSWIASRAFLSLMMWLSNKAIGSSQRVVLRRRKRCTRKQEARSIFCLPM